jgi:hypothetical protein
VGRLRRRAAGGGLSGLARPACIMTGVKKRFGGSHVITLAAAAVLLSACGSAEDISNAASEPSDTTSATSEPSSSAPTETSASEPTAPTTSSEPSTSEPTKTTEPKPQLAPRPVVGNCYATGRKGFSSQRDGSFPVACTKRHTAETFAVFNVGTTPLPGDIDRIWRSCQPKFREYVGGAPTISTLGLTVILPSVAQTDAGQGWIRCDAIQQPSYNGNRGLARSGSLRNMLAGSVPGQFRGCALHWPKVDQVVIFTSCQRSHQAELIPESINLGGPSAPFPGVTTTQSRSKAFCESTFQNYVSETLNYYYYYPTAASWKSGSHDTTCWALDLTGDGLPPI